AGREGECLELLLSMSPSPRDELWYAWLRALASVGHDDERALAIVLDAARPRPPEMTPVQPGSSYEFDVVLTRRGTAIDALGYFGRFADRVVEALIDALTTFQEYDPDWGYQNGEHGRVVHALSKLGPAAAAAVPALAQLL